MEKFIPVFISILCVTANYGQFYFNLRSPFESSANFSGTDNNDQFDRGILTTYENAILQTGEDDLAFPTLKGNGNQEINTKSANEHEKKERRNKCGSLGLFCDRENYIKAIGLRWSSRVQNGTGFFIRGPNGSRRYVPVGYLEPNGRYGQCQTPFGQLGTCRHLEHCVLEEFRYDFLRFLEYTCPIPYGGFMGVCCTNEGNENNEETPIFLLTTPKPRPRPSTTSAPIEEPQVKVTRQCGHSERKASRIVGGRIADPSAWSWMAALIRSKPDFGDIRFGQFCGAVLITEFHLLTAAHCVDQLTVNDIKVRLGEYDFSQRTIRTMSQDFEVVSIGVHEKYNRYSYQNDIAILRLANSSFFNKKIRPICLPQLENVSYEGEIGSVTGWGTIYYGGPISNALMEVQVPIWKQEDCKAAYTQPIQETNLCAGVKSGSRDSCQGDSGGPLQLQGKDKIWRVVGIVSWGIRCAEPGYPGIYTRISKYLSWIDAHL